MPNARSVQVTIGEGTTDVQFNAVRPVGNVRICKRGGSGVTGTFGFSAISAGGELGGSAQVAVGACAEVVPVFGQVPIGFGFEAHVREQVPAGTRASGIVVEQGGRVIAPTGVDLAKGAVHFPLVEGVTTVTYTNELTSEP